MNRQLRHIRFLKRQAADRFVSFSHRFSESLRRITSGLSVAAFVGSLATLTCCIVYVGFDHPIAEVHRLRLLMRFAQGIFIANVLFNLIFNRQRTLRESRAVKWVVDAAILLTLLPWIYPRPVHPWIPWLAEVLYSNYFLYPAMVAYSVVDISYGVMKLMGKRTNPSLMLSVSFLVFIMLGSLLLMLPRCTYGGISYVDSLFVATSAVCITGLTPVDISVTFTPFGLGVLACLIQIGGLGVLTFTSFFALFFTGNNSVYSQLVVKDLVYSKTMSSLGPTLVYILSFTIVVEALGAVAIFFAVGDELPLGFNDRVVFAMFHSLSAFCNAGFSNIQGGMANPLILWGNQSVYWVMSTLVVAGSIGFPLLVNLRDAAGKRAGWIINRRIRGDRSARRPVHLWDVNTRIVVTTFFILLAIGAVAFFALEYDNTLAPFTLSEKVTQSVFNAVTPRSAGFVSVNPARFLNTTLLIVMFLMWIGGASQSTAGGIKVNTFAAIMLNLRSIILGHEAVVAYRRRIAIGSIRRANAVVALSILTFMLFTFVLIALEPAMSVRDLVFESCSAVFTVGSSLGATSQLSPASLVLLSLAMFIGRVGLISLLTGIARRSTKSPLVYPTDNIIIN